MTPLEAKTAEKWCEVPHKIVEVPVPIKSQNLSFKEFTENNTLWDKIHFSICQLKIKKVTPLLLSKFVHLFLCIIVWVYSVSAKMETKSRDHSHATFIYSQIPLVSSSCDIHCLVDLSSGP